MNILAVDDEYHALDILKDALAQALPDSDVAAFEDPEDALFYATEHKIDVAFLDVEMREMTGLALAKKLKDLHGKTNIIFVTGHKQYALDAMNLHASGYLTKPVSAEDIIKEMEYLRFPAQTVASGIRVQCFGNFEIFVDGNMIHFGRAKSKEMLAYLVDRRGASASKKEIAAILWEDAPYDRSKQKQLDNIIAEMMQSLKAAGAEQIIIKKSGLYAVDVSSFTCDAYAYSQGEVSAVNAYRGEYMMNYSWAEFSVGFFTQIRNK